MSTPNSYGILMPWLAAQVEEEVESALGYWESSPSQRAKSTASQMLEAMYVDDGSNLRIEVCRNVDDKAIVQLAEFTQTEDDEPIDAIVSDSEVSIKIRFSKRLRAQLEEKRRYRITQYTKGGMIRLKEFEIIVPRFSTSDEDPIHLLLMDAEFQGAHGCGVYGHPRPIETSPKMKRLLKRFHRTKSDDGGDDSAPEDTPEGSDDELLSQGDPSEASQSQFGTQAPFSQALLLQKERNCATIGPPTVIKKESVEQTSAWKQVQPRSADPRAVLALIGQQRRHHVPVDASMPPPARPKVASQHANSPSSHPKDQNPKRDALEDVDEEEHEEVTDQVMHDEDTPDLISLDEEINVANDSGEPETLDEQPGLGDGNTSEATGLSAELQVPKGASNPNNTPTSYQIPVVSSSTVPTTNSSIPSVLPTVEKDQTPRVSQKCKERLFHHPGWNCMLPATRSACKIPQDQELILKKPTSILPSPIGQRFPVGNVPNPVLTNISAKAEERSRRLRVAENNAEDPEDHSVAAEDVPQGHTIADAVVDIGSSPPPTPTLEIEWSSSPVRPVKHRADLPPDSDLPEEQDPGESAVFPQTRGTKRSHQPTAEIPSSPPHASSQAKFQDDLMDDESDLETSVPQAFAYAKHDQLLHSHADRVDDLGSRKDDPSNQMPRHVSSSGKPYTHLHLSEAARPLRMTTSSISGTTPPVTQPPRPPPREEHNISSSAPVIPCLYEIEGAPQHSTQQVFTFDGSAESRMVSLPDQEDALVERQIQNEQASRSSKRRNLTSPSLRNRSTPASPTVRRERASQSKTSSADGSPGHTRSKDPPIKREAHSPSPTYESRKRAKKSHANFHFSQDPPLSQDPSAHLRDERNQFFTKEDNMASPDNRSQQRRGSGSSASNRTASEFGTSPARSLSARSTKYSVKVKKEPAEDRPNTTSTSWQRSTPSMRRPTSSNTNSSTSRVNTPVKVKTEVVEEDDRPPSSPMETDVISKPVSPEAMDIDVPTGRQFQDSAIGSATTEAHRATAPEDTTHVEETVLHSHSKSPQNETQGIPQTDVSITDGRGTPVDPTTPSLAEKKTLPTTEPQQIAANDTPVNPPSDPTTPSLAEKETSRTTGPQQIVENDTLVNPSGDVDAIQPPPEVEPPREDPSVAKPGDTFSQFSQAYPEYTGNRKHFENLCEQLDSLRKWERGLHPFLWDDYIIRSRIDFKSYTEECADEGINPLPWHKHYMEAIPMPKFNRGIMNPAMLEKFFAEQGRPFRPFTHQNISRIEPPSNIAPFSDNPPRGRDNYRPRGSKRQRGRKNAHNLQQYGSTSSPLQHKAKQLTAPSTAYPITGTSPAPNNAQPSVTSTAHQLPRKPPQPAPAPASGPSPKPPAATVQQPPTDPGQNRAPAAPAPPTSATPAKAALAPSARPAFNKSLIPTPTAKDPVKNPNSKSNYDKSNGNGNGMPASSTAAHEKRPNGMPAPPPPASSAGGGAKGDKVKPKTMFELYKEQRKNKSRAGGSRAGSLA